jgi:hypothetical protein
VQGSDGWAWLCLWISWPPCFCSLCIAGFFGFYPFDYRHLWWLIYAMEQYIALSWGPNDMIYLIVILLNQFIKPH